MKHEVRRGRKFVEYHDDGTPNTRSETLRFPNFLQNVGAADLKEWLTELMAREARQRLVN